MPPKFITYTLNQPDNIAQLLEDTYGFSLQYFNNFAKTLEPLTKEKIAKYIINHTNEGDLYAVIHLIFKYYNNLPGNDFSKVKDIKNIMNDILRASIMIESRSFILPEEVLRLY